MIARRSEFDQSARERESEELGRRSVGCDMRETDLLIRTLDSQNLTQIFHKGLPDLKK